MIYFRTASNVTHAAAIISNQEGLHWFQSVARSYTHGGNQRCMQLQ
jgi:hypothetical protein